MHTDLSLCMAGAVSSDSCCTCDCVHSAAGDDGTVYRVYFRCRRDYDAGHENEGGHCGCRLMAMSLEIA